MPCRTGCLTQDHGTWGACAQASGLQIDRAGLTGARDVNRAGEKTLTAYAQARKAGLQPQTTQLSKIRQAYDHGITQ